MWLCIRFALLPLESLWLETLSGKDAQVSQAIAISEKHRIICCNQAAYQKGIRQGQSVSTGYALLDDLSVVERNAAQEEQRLNQLALQAYPFSPMLAIWPPDRLVIEIGRSLNLFQGLDNLLSSIESSFRQQEITFCLAIGPTPKAAEVFSYSPLSISYQLWNAEDNRFDESLFLERLHGLPIGQLMLSSKVEEKLRAIGLKKVGELFQLSEASLTKRLGRETTHYLQQLTGKRPDVQRFFQPNVSFDQRLEFIDVIHHQKALLFPMRRLLEDLIRFLRLYQKSGQSIQWELVDIYQKHTRFDVHLAQADLNLSLYLELTRLTLESVQLTGPIESIRLTMDQLTRVETGEQSLFAQSEAFKNERHFASKIMARLGHDSCYWLEEKNQVIPELAQQKSNKREEKKHTGDVAPLSNVARPSWLLPVPQAIGRDKNRLYWQGRLTLISQPERIVHYWWKKPVARDYFIAQHQRGNYYWVFFDELKQCWFLHGVFA